MLYLYPILIIFAVYFIISFILLILTTLSPSLQKYRIITKPIACIGYLFLAFFCKAFVGSNSYSLHMIPGFLLCFAGDFVLSLKDRLDYKKCLVLGQVLFLCGHFCFLYAFHQLVPFTPLQLIIPVLTLLIAIRLSKSPNMDFDNYKIPVLTYSFGISFVASKGIFVFLSNPSSGLFQIIIAGTISFFISDILLLFTYFYKKKHPAIRFVNLLTYLLAEYLLAISILIS